MRYLKRIPKGLTEKQEQSVGAIIFWLAIRKTDDPYFNKWLATACIRQQGYFDPKVVG